MGFGFALRVFWAVWWNAKLAGQVKQLLEGQAIAESPASAAPKPAEPASSRPAAPSSAAPSSAAARPAPPSPGRSDALTLLSTLQREARLLDIVQEPLASYSDEQIGAAARDVLRNCSTVLQRMFALRPVTTEAEGSVVQVPPGYDPQHYRVVGNVAGDPPFQGKLMHPGWMATQCELPVWKGRRQAANIIAPVEVEVG